MSISLSKYISVIKNNNNSSIVNIIAIIIIVCGIIAIIRYKSNLTRLFEPFQDNTPKSFIDRIDKFVYINLENRPDRKKLIEPELSRMGVPPEKVQRVAGVYIPKNGHKGCIQSHILAIKLAQMNNWSSVAIFEDDAVIMEPLTPEEFKTKLNGAMDELPEDWNVLMLAVNNKKETPLTDKKYVNKLNAGTSGYGYIVNGNYYDKILRLFEYCNSMMTDKQWGKDNGHEPFALDQKWSELQDQDNWFCMKDKDIIGHRNTTSTINSMGKKVDVDIL